MAPRLLTKLVANLLKDTYENLNNSLVERGEDLHMENDKRILDCLALKFIVP